MTLNSFIKAFSDQNTQLIGIDLRYDTDRLAMFNTMLYMLEMYYSGRDGCTCANADECAQVKNIIDTLAAELGYCNVNYDYRFFIPLYNCCCNSEINTP